MNKKSERFLELIQSNTLLGDGAIGTEFFRTAKSPITSIEGLNIKLPDMVSGLHQKYIEAGSRVIETNTFGANRINLARINLEKQFKEINSAAVELAIRASGNNDVFIAGSIGPVRGTFATEENLSTDDKCAALVEQAGLLAESGVDLLIFETFTDLEELTNSVRLTRKSTDIPIIAQMAFEEGGLSPYGFNGAEAGKSLIEAGADVIGANCGGGVPAVMKAATAMLGLSKPVSAFLNAGFAEQFEGRQVFTASDSYLAERALELAQMNVRLIGGCCGTTPDTIKTMAALLKTLHPADAKIYVSAPISDKKSSKSAPISIPKGVLVELDPPKNLDLNGIRAAASALSGAGVRYITVADNPLASVRVDNIAVSGILQRETGATAIPHLTGRDRNRIALQSAIMAAHCTGIRHLICVTGDPVRMYHESNTTGVFDVNSVSLVKMAAEFNIGQRLNPENRTSFAIGVGFNPNVRSIEGQLSKLKRKIEAGAHFVLTQPVYTSGRLEETLEGFAKHSINIPLFCGILPLTSLRNAEFLHNEVPGIVIPAEFREYLARFPELKDQKKAAKELTLGLTESMLKLNKSFYLITPRNDTDFIIPILDILRSKNIQLS